MSEAPSATQRQPPWPAPLVAPLPEGRFAKHEEWAWARIANALPADMAAYPGDDADASSEIWLDGVAYEDKDRPDPQNGSTYKPHHKLSGLFLRTILFHEPWASAPERPSVSITNAIVSETVNWSERETKGALALYRCRFEGATYLHRLHVPGILDLQGSVFVGELNCDRARIDSYLFCRDGFVTEGGFNLLGAYVGANAEFVNATIKGQLTGDGLLVEGSLFFRGGSVAEGEIRLLGAHVDHDVSFIGSTLRGDLSADGLLVDGSLFLREMSSFAAIKLISARIGHNLQLRSSHLEGEINLTGASIGGELHMDVGPDSAPTWAASSNLILRNASAAAIAGQINSFRRDRTRRNLRRADFVAMDLTGFRYERLGGLQSRNEDTLAAAQSDHLICFLEAGAGDGKTFNPDPYRQLASALETAGNMEKARRILRAMAGHEHRASKGWRKFWLSFSWLFIRYGYSSITAVMWFAALVFGFTIWGLNMAHPRPLDLSGAGFAEFFRWLGFSFANAVPLISFDKAHETFLAAHFGQADDPGSVPVWIAWAFYAEKVLGFVILTYLAAGLSGLARPSSGKD